MLRYLFHIIILLMVWNSTLARNKAMADSCLQVLNRQTILDAEQKCHLLYQIILNQTNPDSCIVYADKLIDIAQTINHPLYLHRGLYEKGQALMFKSLFNESISLLLQSLSIAKKEGLSIEVGLCYYALSQVYKIVNNSNLAIQSLQKSVQYFNREPAKFNFIGTSFYQLGSIYLELDILDSALINFNKALIYFDTKETPVAVIYIRGNIGAIQAKLNQPDSARINLLYAVNALEQMGDDRAAIHYYLYLSKNELNANQPLKALDYVNKAQLLVKSFSNPELRRDINEQLAQIYLQLGDYAKAYHYQKEYYTLRDSLINIDVVTQMANLRTEFEVGQKQAEVDKLEEINRAKTRVMVFMIVGLGLVSALLVVILVGYRQKLGLTRKLQLQKKKLAARKLEMEEANSAKDRLFSVISHDLRGPVGSLKNLSTLIVQSLDHRRLKDAEELAISMSDASQQVEFLLDNLLHWSVSRQNLYKPKKDTFEFNQLVNEVMKVYLQAAKAKQIQLTYNPCFAGMVIESDPNCWATIIRNLVNNAIKFTHMDGRIEVTSCYNNGHVRLEVIDNGLGMNAEQVSHLFNFAGKKSEWGTKNEKGQGLGLCLVHDFVTMLEGAIEIQSQPGQGSKFIVTIPANLVQMGEQIRQMHLFEESVKESSNSKAATTKQSLSKVESREEVEEGLEAGG